MVSQQAEYVPNQKGKNSPIAKLCKRRGDLTAINGIHESDRFAVFAVFIPRENRKWA